MKHQAEGECATEGSERKEIDNLIFLFFPSSVFAIVLQRGGKQLVGDWSIDFSSVSEDKECTLDTCNSFTFVAYNLAKDNRLSQFFIECDFSAGTSFCGSTNILKINSGIPFRANSYFCIYREVYQKITN